VDSDLSYTTGGDASWQKVSYPYYYDSDSAQGTAWDSGNSWLQTEVEGEGTVTFWWKVSSEYDHDFPSAASEPALSSPKGQALEFYVDDVRRGHRGT
jgi:hypothetical protein